MKFGIKSHLIDYHSVADIGASSFV